MGLERIKTYEDLDNLLFDIDYRTLSDDDINRLCGKVWDICESMEAQIRANEKNPDLGIISINSAQMEAAARVHKLQNCTEERIRRNIEAEQAAWDKQGTRLLSDEAHMTEHERSLQRLIHG